MSKITTKLSLVTILGLGACVSEQSGLGSFYDPKLEYNAAQPLIQSPSSSASHAYRVSDNNQERSSDINTTDIGPFRISQDSISLGLRALPLPQLQIPFERYSFDSQYERQLGNVGFDYQLSNQYNPSLNGWIVGNGNKQIDEEPLPLNILGRATKKLIFDNCGVIRDLSNALQSPVKATFGRDSSFEMFYMGDNNLGAKLGIGNNNFGQDYFCKWGLDLQATSDGDIGINISFEIKTGRRPPIPLLRY